MRILAEKLFHLIQSDAFALLASADVVLLMEFCEGGSLETVSKKLRGQNRRVGETIVAKLAEGILRGLDFLHGRKIIHRGAAILILQSCVSRFTHSMGLQTSSPRIFCSHARA